MREVYAVINLDDGTFSYEEAYEKFSAYLKTKGHFVKQRACKERIQLLMKDFPKQDNTEKAA